MLRVGVLGVGAIATPYHMATSCDRPAPVADDISPAFTIKPLGEDLLDARTLF